MKVRGMSFAGKAARRTRLAGGWLSARLRRGEEGQSLV